MIYIDTSVALAHVLTEDRAPPGALWEQTLVSSRLLEYEMWNRIHARGLGNSHGNEVRALIGRVGLIELAPPVLARALEPFPVPVSTPMLCTWPPSNSCTPSGSCQASQATTSG